MPARSRFALLLIGAAVTLTSACGGSSDATTTLAPSASMATETFSGTVDVGGSDFHTFSVAQSGGQINVTLTAASPPSTIFMGLGVGAPSGSTCAILTNAQTLTQAGTVAQLSGTVNAGTYCVVVYDAGNQTSQIAYSLTVTHF